MASPPPPPSCRIVDDASTGRAVFVAPGRADRPGSASLEACPFCAGHEHLAPHDQLRIPADPRQPWHARVIPNRYPLVIDSASPGSTTGTGSRAAHGVHDVIVESPRHDLSILDVERASWLASWTLARDRLAALAARPDLAWGMVFKNSGPAAGASLDHVHSQLVALDFVPSSVAPPGGSGCDVSGLALAEAERQDRIVAELGGLVAFVPRAPRQPFETWIVPRAARGWFHAADDGDVEALADLSRGMVARLGRAAPGADYNWWLLQAPFAGRGPAGGGWRWRLEILPRITPLAGFELGTGCHVCVETPEASARVLRRDA